jgi:hypothetical protein
VALQRRVKDPSEERLQPLRDRNPPLQRTQGRGTQSWGTGEEIKTKGCATRPEVDRMMDELRERKLVDYKWIHGRTEHDKKKGWYITNEGRQAIPQS